MKRRRYRRRNYRRCRRNGLVAHRWQEAAVDARIKGYPWSVWGTRNGKPMVLLGSHKTKKDAERYAEEERRILRPRKVWTVIVSKE